VIRTVSILLAGLFAIAALAHPHPLPCRASWLAPKCDKAFADPERYRHLVRVCREEGFEP
jgi:hypothetical protein